MIVRARTVVTMDGCPIDNGAVLIQANRIRDAGPFAEIKAGSADSILDLGEQILLPGLINAHCHLDYTMMRGTISPPLSFADWIQKINAAKTRFGPDDYLHAIVEGIAEARRFGTTTIVNMEAFPELVARVPAQAIRIWWCAELIDVRGKVQTREILKMLRSATSRFGDNYGGIGLAPHAPFTASAKLYAECAAFARSDHLLPTTHLAESRQEMEMFRDARGPLFDFLKNIGRSMDDCGSSTPLAVFLNAMPVDERWLIAHLNELTENDFRLLAAVGKFSIAHCPRSHDYFDHTEFPLHKLRDLGFNICLGTDSLATNSSLSLFEEMRACQRQHSDLPAAEIIACATRNPAHSLGFEGRLGVIAPNAFADLIAIPSSMKRDPYEEILTFDGAVSWMMVDGQIVDLT